MKRKQFLVLRSLQGREGARGPLHLTGPATSEVETEKSATMLGKRTVEVEVVSLRVAASKASARSEVRMVGVQEHF